ncbi:MAG TPA: LPS assembly lipoprotein LptE [Afifellaceae bacterium]|nr:LPS assembly lipoprotein LptE [Afifellaceae bacterium]
MSWAERSWRVGLVAVALALAGCQVRPLYAPGPDGVSVASVLPAIDIAPPQTRPEQEFRNALLFRLRGGQEGAPPQYRLEFGIRLAERSVSIEQITGTPAAYQVVGNVSIVLRDGAGGRVLLRDRASALASYDRSTQEFANVRARQDAERRVAETLAEIVAAKLAAHLAAR